MFDRRDSDHHDPDRRDPGRCNPDRHDSDHLDPDQHEELAMGYSVWWLAVSGKTPDAVLDELGLARGEETDWFYGRPLVAGTLPTGWFFVYLNREAPVWYYEPQILALSAGCRVLTCEAEEHAMASSATEYAEGRKLWHVKHDEPGDLTADGDLPPEYAAIAESFSKQQEEADREGEEVDYLFDVPVELSRALTGFRHDSSPPRGTVFHVLEAVRPPWSKPPRTPRAPEPPAPAPPPPTAQAPSTQERLSVERPARPWWRFW
jgi:hypothetical protein